MSIKHVFKVFQSIKFPTLEVFQEFWKKTGTTSEPLNNPETALFKASYAQLDTFVTDHGEDMLNYSGWIKHGDWGCGAHMKHGVTLLTGYNFVSLKSYRHGKLNGLEVSVYPHMIAVHYNENITDTGGKDVEYVKAWYNFKPGSFDNAGWSGDQTLFGSLTRDSFKPLESETNATVAADDPVILAQGATDSPRSAVSAASLFSVPRPAVDAAQGGAGSPRPAVSATDSPRSAASLCSYHRFPWSSRRLDLVWIPTTRQSSSKC